MRSDEPPMRGVPLRDGARDMLAHGGMARKLGQGTPPRR